jgi:hypothetical protein
MARIRSLVPRAVLEGPSVDLPDATRLVYLLLPLLADDHGNCSAKAKWIACQLFEDNGRAADVQKALDTLAAENLIALYEVEGEPFLHINAWLTRLQAISKMGRAGVPYPPWAVEGKPETCEPFGGKTPRPGSRPGIPPKSPGHFRGSSSSRARALPGSGIWDQEVGSGREDLGGGAGGGSYDQHPESQPPTVVPAPASSGGSLRSPSSPSTKGEIPPKSSRSEPAPATAPPATDRNPGVGTFALAPPEPVAPPPKPKKGAKKPAAPASPLELVTLTPYERQVHDAIMADPYLSPIVKDPAEAARRFVRLAPTVDLPLEIGRAGTWLFGKGSRKQNGVAFLLNWISRVQGEGGTPGWTPPSNDPPKPKRPPPPTPPGPDLTPFMRERPAHGHETRLDEIGRPPGWTPGPTAEDIEFEKILKRHGGHAHAAAGGA